MTLGELWRRCRFVLNRDRFGAELEEEMQLHADLRAEQVRRENAASATTLRAMRPKFGNAALLKEESRDVWSIQWLEESVRDMAFAIRQMRKAPGFTAVAIVSLALGIGANTAIFTMIQSTLLRPIPVKDAGELRLLTWRSEESRRGWMAPSFGYRSPTYGWMYEHLPTADGAYIHAEFSPPFYRNFLRYNLVFESLFGFKELGRVTALVDGGAEPLNAFLVSGDFYRGVDVSPVLGRAIGPGDDVNPEAASVAVISYEYWTRRFGRSPSALGKTISLNGVPVTIIGVNPEYFTGIVPGGHFEIWAPLHLLPSAYGQSLFDDASWRIQIMGRLRPDVSDARALSALDLIFQQQLDGNYLAAPHGELLKDPAKRPHLMLADGSRGVDYVTDHYGRMLFAVFALAGLVLTIACANVANLLLARCAARQREIALRLALGAGRGRIARQLLAEGLPLAAIAGAAGVIMGYFARNSVPALLAAPWRSNPFESAFDGRVLLVSVVITFATAVLFSLAPAWQSLRVDVNDALKDASRGSAGLSKLRMGGALVVLQVGFSLALVAGAGMCVKTFTNLRALPLGVRPEGVLLFTLEPPPLRYPDSRIGPLLTKVQGAMEAIPGVQSATFADGGGGFYIGANSGQPEITYASHAAALAVGSRFFETMGIRIVYGRAISQGDARNGPSAVVVNREFARHFFHRDNPVGLTFTASDGTGGSAVARDSGVTQFRIVGVCDDWHVDWLRDPIKPAVYTAALRNPRAGRANLKLRIGGNSARVALQLREAVRSIDPELAVTDVRTLTAEIENSLSQERLMASLATVFGAIALVLASIGIYGVMAYAVARRTNEIGIRIALGARPQRVVWTVLRQTFTLVLCGVAVGVPAILGLSPVLDRALAPTYRESFAYGLKPNDPIIIAVAVLSLGMVTLLAGFLPARRAAQVDPMVALRHD
ncbi:MAG: efflux pump, inner rane subunit [Bryobacterales bacterium]|jgi:predicted permease|nr:efflux pump, inner rane subunit [Bryobacterales bacterium]